MIVMDDPTFRDEIAAACREHDLLLARDHPPVQRDMRDAGLVFKERAEALMRSSQIRRLPVVDEVGKLVGVIALNDLARTATHVRGRKPRTVELEDVVTTLAAVCEPRSMPQQAAA